MKPLLIISLLFLNQISWTQSQPDDYYIEMQKRHAKAFGYDPEYRVNYFENISIKTTIDSDIANYQFRDLNSGTSYDLSPVAESLIGFSMDYKWFAIGVAFGPKFLLSSDDQELKENSQSFKIDLNTFYSDQWGQTFSFLYNKGFNVEFTGELLNDDLSALKDTEFQFYGGSTYFIANKNFSYRAHINQTERQLKSAGSFVPKVSYAYSVTNPNLPESSTELIVDKIKSFDIIADIGYYYSFIHNKRWYLTLGAQPGVGYNHSNYKIVNEASESFNSVIFTVNGEVAIGFNSYRWYFGGIGYWRNYNNTNNEREQINRDSAFFKIHLGYRFNDNLPMRKFFGWFEKKLGLEY